MRSPPPADRAPTLNKPSNRPLLQYRREVCAFLAGIGREVYLAQRSPKHAGNRQRNSTMTFDQQITASPADGGHFESPKPPEFVEPQPNQQYRMSVFWYNSQILSFPLIFPLPPPQFLQKSPVKWRAVAVLGVDSHFYGAA